MKREAKRFPFLWYISFMSKEMTLDERMNYIHQNHLEQGITKAMMYNNFGFAILPSIGHFFLTDTGVYYNCKTIQGDTDLPFLTKEQFDNLETKRKEDILNSIKDPGHTTVDILNANGKYSILVFYQKDSTQEERRKNITELEIRQFLSFTNTKNNIGIRSLIQQADDIVQNWKPF